MCFLPNNKFLIRSCVRGVKNTHFEGVNTKRVVYSLSFPLLLLSISSLFSMHRHFTATAFIIDSKGRTLLLWHKRLNRWMPPGGHIDDNETPEEAARRECKEET